MADPREAAKVIFTDAMAEGKQHWREGLRTLAGELDKTVAGRVAKRLGHRVIVERQPLDALSALEAVLLELDEEVKK